MIGYLLLAISAFAGNWTVTNAVGFDIKSTIGPAWPMDQNQVLEVGKCFTSGVSPAVLQDPGCVPADGGLTWTSSWSKITCKSVYDSAKHEVSVYAYFTPSIDANGWVVWPTSWPTTFDCSRTFVSPHPQAGFTHTFRTNITAAADQSMRFDTAQFSTTLMSLTTGKALTVGSAFDAEEWLINIVDGTYTGATNGELTRMYTAATGGSTIAYSSCGVTEGAGDDYLYVVLDDEVADLNGAAAGRGTFYCRVIKDGVNYAIPFAITVN